jgi:MFS family permease
LASAAVGAPATQSAHTTTARRKRDFSLLLRGSTVSMLGSRVSAIGYPLLALALTGSAADAGWITFAAIAPGIAFYFPAGALVDRVSDPRRLLIGSELVRGLAIASIVVTLAMGWRTMALLAGVAAAEQGLGAFSDLAGRRLCSALLERGQETEGLARLEGWTHVAVLVGRPLGGLFFAIWRALPFMTDVLSFLLAVTALLRIGGPEHRAEARQRRRMPGGHGMWESFLWLRGNPFGRMAVLITTGTTFVGQALIIIFLADAHGQGMSTLAIEIFLGSSGAGGALGSLAAPWLFSQFRYVLLQIQVVMWAVTFVFLACLVVVADRPFIGMTAATGILGFAGALGNVAVSTYFVRHSPESVLAQVISIDRLTSLSALALGPLAGGLAAQLLGARDAMLVLSFAAIVMAAAVSGVMIRMVRARPDGTRLGVAGDWAAGVLDRRPVLGRRPGDGAPGSPANAREEVRQRPSEYRPPRRL